MKSEALQAVWQNHLEFSAHRLGAFGAKETPRAARVKVHFKFTL